MSDYIFRGVEVRVCIRAKFGATDILGSPASLNEILR
jgi:hypothetical protein